MIRKVLMVIAQKDFRDEELFDPKTVLEQAGFVVKISAKTKSLATGRLGAQVDPDLSFSEVNPAQFEGLILVGGPGAETLIGDEELGDILAGFAKDNKLISAICFGPAILAEAGIIKGLNATVHSSAIDYLTRGGANYTGEDISEDQNIITANGPAVASRFAKEIVNFLNKTTI